jgi:hypothetical protein
LRPVALGFVNLLSDSMSSGQVCITSGRELFAFSAKHTHYFLSVLSCCVVCVFSWTGLEISVSDTDMGRQLQIVRTMWCSRPDAILGKASRAAKVQPSGRAFESVWAPRSVLQINIEDVRTSEQHRPDARSSVFNKESVFRSRHCLGSICKPSGRRGNTSGQCPVVQNIAEFRSNAEGILTKIVWTLGQAVRT